MAKGILQVIGGFALIFGVIVAGQTGLNIMNGKAPDPVTPFLVAAALLVTGAILQGLGQAIGLLQKIERNTAPR